MLESALEPLYEDGVGGDPAPPCLAVELGQVISLEYLTLPFGNATGYRGSCGAEHLCKVPPFLLRSDTTSWSTFLLHLRAARGPLPYLLLCTPFFSSLQSTAAAQNIKWKIPEMSNCCVLSCTHSREHDQSSHHAPGLKPAFSQHALTTYPPTQESLR